MPSMRDLKLFKKFEKKIQVMSHETSYHEAYRGLSETQDKLHNVIPILGISPSEKVVVCFQRGNRRIHISVHPLTDDFTKALKSQSQISRWFSNEDNDDENINDNFRLSNFANTSNMNRSSNNTNKLAAIIRKDYSEIEIGLTDLNRPDTPMQRSRLSKSTARMSFAMFLANAMFNECFDDKTINFASRYIFNT